MNVSMINEIDNAFDWLILVVSTIIGILIGLPATIEAKKVVAGWFIPPFFVLVATWLLSHLIRLQRIKVILKIYAWLYAFIIISIFGLMFADILYGFGRTFHTRVVIPFPPLGIALGVFWLFGVPFILFDLLIRPVYKETYKDSKLLNSRKRLILLYVIVIITFLIFMIPIYLAGGLYLFE